MYKQDNFASVRELFQFYQILDVNEHYQFY